MSQDLFQIATRNKFRFATVKGALSVEDLWDLPLTSATGRPNLDAIAQDLHKQIRSTAEVTSFVTPSSEASAAVASLQAQFDVVKTIIDAKVVERDAASKARARAEERQKLMQILAEKKEGALGALSIEELEKRLEAL